MTTRRYIEGKLVAGDAPTVEEVFEVGHARRPRDQESERSRKHRHTPHCGREIRLTIFSDFGYLMRGGRLHKLSPLQVDTVADMLEAVVA